MGTRAQGLLAAVVVWNLTTLSHGADHLRQGLGRLSFEVFAIASTGALLALLTLALVLREHRYAPHLAIYGGVNVALGLVASHFMPHWSAFSDPYQDAGVDALSWGIAIVDAGAALLAAYVGYRVLFGPGRVARHGAAHDLQVQ